MSYTNFLYHLVFGTKGRLPLIHAEIKPRLHAYLGGTVRGLGGIALEVNGIEDHVHLLVKLKPTIRFSDFLRDLKSNSSVWAKENGMRRFAWQRRYGAFTVSESQREIVRRTSGTRSSITSGLISKPSLRRSSSRTVFRSTNIFGKSDLSPVNRLGHVGRLFLHAHAWSLTLCRLRRPRMCLFRSSPVTINRRRIPGNSFRPAHARLRNSLPPLAAARNVFFRVIVGDDQPP